KLDGIDVSFSGESNTLIVRNIDQPGCITEVAASLSEEDIDIATMQVFRDKKGGCAVMVVETDQVVSRDALDRLEGKEGIVNVTFLNVNGSIEEK
ncbi:ACT domain protein, partial [[Clostridium] hylemonae DSM 15053]